MTYSQVVKLQTDYVASFKSLKKTSPREEGFQELHPSWIPAYPGFNRSDFFSTDLFFSGYYYLSPQLVFSTFK